MPATRKRKITETEDAAPEQAPKISKGKRTAATSSKTTVPKAATSDESLSHLVREQSWSTHLQGLFAGDDFQRIEEYLNGQWSHGKTTYPPKGLIFEAFNRTPFDQVKVVILGQDPYHDDGQAHGLAFSVLRTVQKLPPSLKNIFKELSNDIPGFKAPMHGCLEKWAQSGVLLLNATLTVEPHAPNSHSRIGWQQFTDQVIRLLSDERSGLVFLLWGGFAHAKEKLIDPKKHTVIKTAHPSPLSFNKFVNCKCFSRVNTALEAYGQQPLDWSIE